MHLRCTFVFVFIHPLQCQCSLKILILIHSVAKIAQNYVHFCKPRSLVSLSWPILHVHVQNIFNLDQLLKGKPKACRPVLILTPVPWNSKEFYGSSCDSSYRSLTVRVKAYVYVSHPVSIIIYFWAFCVVLTICVHFEIFFFDIWCVNTMI